MNVCIVETAELKKPANIYDEEIEDLIIAMYKTFYNILLNKSVSELNISTRGLNVCLRNNMKTVGDLVNAPVSKISVLRGGGPRVMQEIYEVLSSLNLTCEQWNVKNYRRSYNYGIRKRLVNVKEEERDGI